VSHLVTNVIFLAIHACFLDSQVNPDRYTISAARASFIDNDLGSLSIGKLADFVILSTDSWKDFAETASASIEATYVSGVRAHPWIETPRIFLSCGMIELEMYF